MEFSNVGGKRVINVYPHIFAAKFNPAWMKLDYAKVREAMVSGLRDFFYRRGLRRAVVGLSGGLDSAVVAQVAQEALGRKNVEALALPYRRNRAYRHSSDWQDANDVAIALGINFRTYDITEIVDAAARRVGIDPRKPNLTKLEINRLGNIKARERMTLLFDLSAEVRGMVLGTGNKSEIAVGYCTIYGDSACAIDPVGDLYKTQEFEFARHIGTLQKIIDRVPSAGLFDGQTDEGQLGFRYSELDPLCYLALDRHLSLDEVVQFGFTRRFIARVMKMHNDNEFKFRLPQIINLPQPEAAAVRV
jgi:NAD+ synthase